MEVARLLGTITEIRRDYGKNGLGTQLTLVRDAAQKAVANATDAASQSSFAKALQQLNQQLDGACTNNLPPSMWQVIRAVDVEVLTAPALLAAINRIVDARPFMLSQAAQELQELESTVLERLSTAEAVCVQLGSLGFQPAAYEQGQYELGIRLPSTLTGDDLRETQAQLKHWHRFLDHLSELLKGSAAAASTPTCGRLDASGTRFLTSMRTRSAAVCVNALTIGHGRARERTTIATPGH